MAQVAEKLPPMLSAKKKAYAESILFAREPAASVRILDSDAMCEGQACEAFVKIKCYQPLEAAAG